VDCDEIEKAGSDGDFNSDDGSESYRSANDREDFDQRGVSPARGGGGKFVRDKRKGRGKDRPPPPWNAVCVIGLRVFSMTKDVTIKLVSTHNEEFVGLEKAIAGVSL
jgi:hypothetical protein